MSELLQYVFIGLGNGAVYAMVGLGLVVIYRSTGLLNFAQGELAMFATFGVWTLHEAGLPIWLALLGGMAIGFAIGAIVHQVVVRPVGDPHQKPLAVVIVTIGLFLGFNALAQLIWGTNEKEFATLFGNSEVDVLGTLVDWQKLGALGILAAEALVFWVIFQKTKVGLGMRAVASNPESSALVGIPVTRILMIGWGLAVSVGAVAGAVWAPTPGLSSNLMQLPLIYGFAAITLGGFDSFVGAVVGGLFVGVLTDVVPRYVDAFEKMTLAPAFLVILVVLLVRPQGIFGRKVVSRV
ncbi:MAG: branched-chain amino acid ABC transporter permease [Microthrixaceae bacterium]|jgi:branched-chain amino acid transport system permease protein|nr:branched-chain amino acid ABC transporter permease [Actinomycetota bacterium]MBP6729917.1 branched-chain amino acid ABC transporter permease [Microthrixaceae bacterium]HMS12682.1 branched-chain amino acid ABC transporter permease [Microthrixaceae bacterium]HMT24514.1 branched-chain amino acid ABC transporter permease [Microthrixaceae bacterium]HMT60393.1 branched-chain amino acid ABC transporter permease [Microthrixaceae bacterium]